MTQKFRLQGLSVSAAVLDLLARKPEGNVHSVFRRSANLLFGQSDLVGLVGADVGNAPNAIVVGAVDGEALSPGMPVRCWKDRLLIGDEVAVDLSAVQVWNPDPEPPESIKTPADLAAGRRMLAEAIQAWGSGAGLRSAVERVLALRSDPDMDALGKTAHPRLERLLDAVSRNDRAEALAAALSLVGLGPGLTPSGDDFLAAFFGTMVLVERWGIGAVPGMTTAIGNGTGLRKTGLVGDLLTGVRGKTTLAGEVLLRHALEGRLPEHLAEMVRDLVGGTADCVPKIQKVLAWGSTSGTDMACGTLAALDLLVRHR